MSFTVALLSVTMALGSSSPEKQHPDGVGVLPLTHTFDHGVVLFKCRFDDLASAAGSSLQWRH